MPVFSRGIYNSDFLAAIKSTEIWKLIAHDRELFWGIRKDSINVYHQGCSLFKFSYPENNICCETHYKYLLCPDLRPPYVQWRLDGGLDTDHLKRLRTAAFIDKIDDTLLDNLKKPRNPMQARRSEACMTC
jgi:hypothetical protein